MNEKTRCIFRLVFRHTVADDTTEEVLLVQAPDEAYARSWADHRTYLWGKHDYEVQMLGQLDVAIDVSTRWA